jgi:hypothetical protein
VNAFHFMRVNPCRLVDTRGNGFTGLYGPPFLTAGTPRSFPSDVRLAARNACLGLLIGDFLASPAVDPGLLFYVFAALCCAEPERMPASVPSTQMRHAGARI